MIQDSLLVMARADPTNARNRKKEQQSLAKYGLDWVTDTYLPEKLATMGIILKKA